MKRIISWIEPRRSRFEKFSSPEPLDFYITSARWKPLVFHNHAAKWNEMFGERAWFKNRNRPNIVIRPIKFQTGLFCMPNSEDRYISFTPHLASFYLDWLHKLLSNLGGGGDAGTPLYRPYRYVPPHQVGFLRRFFFFRWVLQRTTRLNVQTVELSSVWCCWGTVLDLQAWKVTRLVILQRNIWRQHHFVSNGQWRPSMVLAFFFIVRTLFILLSWSQNKACVTLDRYFMLALNKCGD